jgi:hypothetical protein
MSYGQHERFGFSTSTALKLFDGLVEGCVQGTWAWH